MAARMTAPQSEGKRPAACLGRRERQRACRFNGDSTSGLPSLGSTPSGSGLRAWWNSRMVGRPELEGLAVVTDGDGH